MFHQPYAFKVHVKNCIICILYQCPKNSNCALLILLMMDEQIQLSAQVIHSGKSREKLLWQV